MLSSFAVFVFYFGCSCLIDADSVQRARRENIMTKYVYYGTIHEHYQVLSYLELFCLMHPPCAVSKNVAVNNKV